MLLWLTRLTYDFFAVYFDHRGASGTHGVYLHSSAGMDVKIDQDANGQQYLEYNLMSGIIDLFFMAGPTPTEVSKQYAEVAGLPAEVPYWSFGLHQCRYGYRDFYGVAEVVANYSAAGIPLETMWTDIGTSFRFTLACVKCILTNLRGRRRLHVRAIYHDHRPRSLPDRSGSRDCQLPP